MNYNFHSHRPHTKELLQRLEQVENDLILADL
jgi:hypothetical protein